MPFVLLSAVLTALIHIQTDEAPHRPDPTPRLAHLARSLAPPQMPIAHCHSMAPTRTAPDIPRGTAASCPSASLTIFAAIAVIGDLHEMMVDDTAPLQLGRRESRLRWKRDEKLGEYNDASMTVDDTAPLQLRRRGSRLRRKRDEKLGE